MLRYAPIDQACTVSSPRIVNPYASSAYAPVTKDSNETLQGAYHKYIHTVYERDGIGGVLRLMDTDIVRDLRRMVTDMNGSRGGVHIHLGLEEIAVVLIALFLIVILMTD